MFFSSFSTSSFVRSVDFLSVLSCKLSSALDSSARIVKNVYFHQSF